MSVREDWLERLVVQFFEQRISGPMRLDKLAKQVRAHDREERRNGKLAGTRIHTDRRSWSVRSSSHSTCISPRTRPSAASNDGYGLEAVADAFENAKALQVEGSSVVARDIAGARFVSRYHPRIVEQVRLAA